MTTNTSGGPTEQLEQYRPFQPEADRLKAAAPSGTAVVGPPGGADVMAGAPGALARDELSGGQQGVLVRPGGSGVHADGPGDQPSRVATRLQAGHNLPPDPGPLLPPKQPVQRLPAAVTLGHVPPRTAHPHGHRIPSM